MTSASGNGTNHLGVNLAFTKFLFIAPAREDEATLTRLRAAASNVSRGYFNDFGAEAARDASPQDSVQFLTSTCEPGAREAREARESTCSRPRYVMQLSSKYRPRLVETESELRRRLDDIAAIDAVDGATRVPQYTSAEMHAYAYRNASARVAGRMQHNVIIIPMSKTAEWWQKNALERHEYFYPHTDRQTGRRVKGHAAAAENGISTIYRRLYYNPDGRNRPGEFDFITYFECSDEHLAIFEQICRSLRDVDQNPEWRFVVEGPEWRGKRVLRW